jgi:hypothetical protein
MLKRLDEGLARNRQPVSCFEKSLSTRKSFRSGDLL